MRRWREQRVAVQTPGEREHKAKDIPFLLAVYDTTIIFSLL